MSLPAFSGSLRRQDGITGQWRRFDGGRHRYRFRGMGVSVGIGVSVTFGVKVGVSEGVRLGTSVSVWVGDGGTGETVTVSVGDSGMGDMVSVAVGVSVYGCVDSCVASGRVAVKIGALVVAVQGGLGGVVLIGGVGDLPGGCGRPLHPTRQITNKHETTIIFPTCFTAISSSPFAPKGYISCIPDNH